MAEVLAGGVSVELALVWGEVECWGGEGAGLYLENKLNFSLVLKGKDTCSPQISPRRVSIARGRNEEEDVRI